VTAEDLADQTKSRVQCSIMVVVVLVVVVAAAFCLGDRFFLDALYIEKCHNMACPQKTSEVAWT